MNNNNDKIYKKILAVLLFFIILLICQFFADKGVYASSKSKEEIGEYIAEFAVNFANDHGSETVYSWNAAHRSAAYQGLKTSGIQETWESNPQSFNDMYAMDCVGWVSMAIHQATGLDSPSVSSGACGFVTPDHGSGYCTYSNGYFEVVSDQPMVGDILIRPNIGKIGHVMIYIGNGQMVDSTGGFTTVQIRPIGDYSQVARISDAGVAAINDSDLTTVFNGHGSITGNLGGGGFEYRGLTPGRIGVRKFEFKWIIPSLGELLNYYIGISTYLSRMVYVGLLGVFEVLIDNTMEAISGVEASLTIEKLLFNKVPILDVNFFDFASAGGQAIPVAEEGEDPSVLLVIRENIAIWYNVLRNLSIILLLITLIYIGIRIAISSAAEQKARYKDLLKSWATSFIIVFSIHYIMIFILTMNQMAIDGIANASTALNGEESLYDSVRNGSYALQATIGFRSLLFYAILIYMLIRFLWTYIKRFIVVSILTLMAPLVGIIYALDKIKDNRAQSFEKWFKEYTYNVIIQSVHAFLYALFVGLALNIAGESFIGVFIALILFMFILKAEGIFKQIFGIKSANMTDVLKNAAAFALAGKAVKAIAGANLKIASKVASPITKPLGEIHRRADSIRRDKKIDKLAAQIDAIKNTDGAAKKVTIGKTSSWTHPSRLMESNETMDFGAISDLDSRKIAKSLFEKKEAIDEADKKELSNRLSQTANTALGVGLMAASIPAIAIDGANGITPMFLGKAHLKKGIKGAAKNSKNYREYRGAKGAIQKAGTARADLETAGMFSTLSGMIRLNKDYIEERQNAIHNAQYEVLKKEMDKKARKEFERLLNDPSIDETELKRAFSQAKSRLSEDTIQDVVFRIDAGKDSYVSTEVTRVAATTDINLVYKEMNTSMRKRKKVYDFDKKGFDEQIKSAVRKEAAHDLGIREVNVTDAQIAAKYSSLSNAQREKIIQNVLDGTSKLTDDRVENDKWRKKDKLERTGMDLSDVNKILDTLTDETHRLNRDNVKDNFKDLIEAEIRLTTGSTAVTAVDIDNYIFDMTHDKLIKTIKSVSALNSSVVDDDLRAKTEFATLLNLVEKAKDAEIKMKGKK